MKKKRNFLLPLLMAIVMMAMSPQKVWAENLTVNYGDNITISSNATYDDVMVDGGTLTIKNGVTVTVNGSCEIWSDIVIIESEATLTVKNNDPNFLYIYGGKLFNYGIIDANVNVDNGNGVFSNLNTVTGKVENSVNSIYNYGDVYEGCSGVSAVCPHDESTTKNPTCTDAGFIRCNECGLIYGSSPATGHTLTAHDAAAATCTTDGYSIACWSCSLCGKYFSDAAGNNVIAASSVVIPATGHNFVNGANCTGCGEAAPAYTLDKSLLQTALNAISGTYTLTFAYSAPEGATQGAALNSDNTIYLYSNGSDYTVAPTTSGAVIMAPADCSGMFVIGGYAFGNNPTTNSKNITSLDLTNFNTENVTNMHTMFSTCSSLTSLDLSGFNTERVTSMQAMFSNCSALTSLDLSSFNTSNVTSMMGMFQSCSQLQSLTIGNFDMQKYITGYYNISLFQSCTNLNTLTLKALPYLTNDTFNTQFTGTGKTVNYVLDDNSVVYTGTNYLPAATTVPTYTRTMTDEWGTLVVPFAVSAAPEGFEFYGIRSMGSNNELYLRKVTSSIEAGTPVFVHRTGSGTSLELTASNKTVNTTLATASGTALQGTYAAVELNKTNNPNAFFVYNEKLYSTQKLGDANHVTINPFRAYLVTPATNGAKQLVFVVEDEATNLTPILSEGEGAMSIYNLNGQKLVAPRKGINIINGRKVLVK